jgi:hypothetical protein
LKAPPKSLQGMGYLVGDDVQERASQLYAWMDPGGGLLGQLIGAAVGALTGGRINLAAKKPPLIFQWGTQIMRCVLSNVQVTFERFSATGNPDRATINFTVQEEFNIFGMLPTNPTSGGMPGRQRTSSAPARTSRPSAPRPTGRRAVARRGRGQQHRRPVPRQARRHRVPPERQRDRRKAVT